MENNSRRNFLKKTAIGMAGTVVGLQSAKSYARILGANDRVQVGIVGFADRAKGSLIPAFLRYSKEMNFEITALSDIWNRRREEGEAFLKEKAGGKIAVCRNNEELYARKDVDAVIISTADFQHAVHCIEAVQAGRDAYVEKPFANTMEDARNVLKAVDASGKVVQVGTQRRSGPNYWEAYDFIKSGKFGDINMVEMTWNVNQPGRWRRPALVSTLKESDVDWKRFLINRPFENFDPRKFIEYRLFWPYSSGIPCQWMVHQIDTVHWFTGLTHPRSVVANGGIYSWPDGRGNFDTMTAVFDYGPADDMTKGFQVVYSSRMGNAAGGTKEFYYSKGGMLNLDTNQVTSDGHLNEGFASAMEMKPIRLEPTSIGEALKAETAANTGDDIMTSLHMKNWMECVRNRNVKTNADVRAGYYHSVALCMTIAAIHSGKRVTFDAAKQEVVVG